jgi:PAS domain S-box-containing protein
MAANLEKTMVSRDYVNNIMETMPNALIVTDAKTRIMTVNKAACHLLGYNQEELIGTPMAKVLGPDQPLGPNLEALIKESELSDLEIDYQTRDGRRVPVRFNGSVIRDALGKTSCIVCTAYDITRRQKAEKALAESERRFRDIAENSAEWIWEVDQHGRYTYASPVVEKLLGYLPEEMLQKHFYDFFHPDKRASLEKAALATFVAQRPFRDSTQQKIKKNGEIVWISTSGVPILDERGRLRGYRGSSIDITARLQAEEAMRASERFLANILDSIQDGISVLDSQYNILRVNPGMEQYFPDALPLIGKQCYAAYHGRNKPCERCPVREALETGQPVVIVEGPRAEGKTPKWVEIYAFPMMDPVTGKFTGAIAYIRDVTQRRQAGEALRESERFLEAIFSSIQDGVSVVDIEYNILRVNPTMERWFPDKVPLPGKKCFTAYRDRLQPCGDCPTFRALETGQTCADEMALAGKPGESFRWVEVQAFPMLDPASEKINGVIQYLRDISQRKATEETLRQSQKMEAVGRLAGGVAHDFNNILTAIIGCCELLMVKFDRGDPRLEDTEEIRNAAERAAALTRQLLAFSRKQIFSPKVLNLNNLIVDLDKMLRRLISEDIELVTLPEGDLGEVMADPGQIEQVIINLVVNARDAMEPGGVITIETHNVILDEEYTRKQEGLQPGDYVMLAVSDSGRGMDETARLHVFEPFFTTKELGKGTGLGLSTVHGIIKQSGGHISVYSEVAQGTTFKIYLPRLSQQPETAAVAPSSCDYDRGSETILLVEDEEIVRQVARRILERNSYTVLEAGSGKEALAVSRQVSGPIHLMLSDVVMSGMSGVEATAQLREQRPEIKVLFMSGHTENSIVHHGVLDPGVAFIQKPFRQEQLVHKVREVLDGPPQTGSGDGCGPGPASIPAP